MPTSPRSTKWYDDNATKYWKSLSTDDGIFHTGFEKPAMYSKLPDLKGKNVLSIGCGPGNDSAYLKSQGAVKSVGTDVSDGMIELAKKQHPECEFEVMDMEELEFDDGSFDFVYSSLALHYLPDWGRVMEEVYRVLKPGGEFLFSSSHPTADAMEWSKQDDSVRQLTLSVKVKKGAEETETHGVYHRSKEIVIRDKFAVTFYHQPLENIFASVLSPGFEIKGFWEPKPTEEMRKVSPHNYALWNELPWLMVMRLRKPS